MPDSGLDPAVASAVQNQFAPMPDAPAPVMDASALQFGPGGVPAYGGLPAPVTAAVQNGFAPPPTPAPVPDAPLPSMLAGYSQQPDGTFAPPDAAPSAPVARPDLPATVVDDSPEVIARQEKAYQQQQAFDNSPEGLAERADAMRQGSINKLSTTDQAAADAEKAVNDATKKVNDDYAGRKAVVDAANAKINAEHAANLDRFRKEEYQANQTAINYKVDTDRHYGAGGLIAIALSGIGQALDHNHGPNAALQILDANIDKRIADQRAQQSQLFKNAELKQGQVSEEQSGAEYDRNQEDRDRATLLGQQADEIKSIASQMNNPLAAQRAMDIAAQRTNASAAILDGVAQRRAQQAAAAKAAAQEAFDNRIKSGELGVKQGTLAETIRARNLEHDEKVAELNAKDPQQLQSMIKDSAERGIYDPNTAEPTMADPRGQPMLDKARDLDAQAAKVADPQQALALRTNAEQTRNQAQLLYGAKFADKETAQKERPMVAAAQSYIDDMDNLREEMKARPGLIDRDEWGKIALRYHKVAADAVQSLGERVSTRSVDAVSDWISDPDTIGGRVAPGKVIAQLDTAINDARAKFAKGMASQGVKNLVLSRPSEVKAKQDNATGASALSTVLKGESNVEAAKDAEPGVVSKLLFNPGDPVGHAEEFTPTTGAGLAPEQEQGVRKLMKGVYGANAEDNAKNLATLLSSDRSATVSGALNVLREDPVVLSAALAYMPPQKRAAVQARLGPSMNLPLPVGGPGVPLPETK